MFGTTVAVDAEAGEHVDEKARRHDVFVDVGNAARATADRLRWSGASPLR